MSVSPARWPVMVWLAAPPSAHDATCRVGRKRPPAPGRRDEFVVVTDRRDERVAGQMSGDRVARRAAVGPRRESEARATVARELRARERDRVARAFIHEIREDGVGHAVELRSEEHTSALTSR